MLQLFGQAIGEYGYPSQVRSDHGLENDVARLIIEHMGTGRGSHIAGSSIYNRRTERLWREVNSIVCRPYRNVFYLESEQLLDSLNELELSCLHQVYKSRINRSLEEFR